MSGDDSTSDSIATTATTTSGATTAGTATATPTTGNQCIVENGNHLSSESVAGSATVSNKGNNLIIGNGRSHSNSNSNSNSNNINSNTNSNINGSGGGGGASSNGNSSSICSSNCNSVDSLSNAASGTIMENQMALAPLGLSQSMDSVNTASNEEEVSSY